MDKVSEEDRREAIVFVLKKLRRMTLDGFKFGGENYEFEFYNMDFDKAQKSPAVMHEIDALRYLHQKRVLDFTEADEPDESLVSKLNEGRYQEELRRFGLVDTGTSIKESAQAFAKSSKRPIFSATGEVVFRGKKLLLPPSDKQSYVAKACLRKWGKQIPELEIIDDLLANSFDARQRVVRDSTPRLNRLFEKAFQVENAFRYSKGYVSIDPSKFETL